MRSRRPNRAGTMARAQVPRVFRNGAQDEMASAQHLAAIVEHSNDAIYSRTMDGRVTSWNAAASVMFGYQAEEMLGRTCAAMLPPHRSDDLKNIVAMVRRGKLIRRFETERLRKDGRLIHVSLTVSPIKSARGSLIGFSTIARDITEQRQAEEAVRRSERELADLFAYAPLALFWVKPNSRIERLNNAAEVWLECDQKSAKEQCLTRFFVQGDAIAGLLSRLASGETVRNFQARLRGARGAIRIVLIDANSSWHNHQQVRTCWFVRDVTSQRRLEQELLATSERERQRLARELHDSLGQHLGGAAYLADALSEQLACQRSPAVPAARRLTRLVESSIRLTRDLAHGMLPVPPEPAGLMFGLGQLASQTARLFGVSCRLLCPKRVLVADSTVAAHLYRIAQEAVHNAIRHGKARQVRIHLRSRAGRITLAVRDDGVGLGTLPPAHNGMGLQIMKYRAGLLGGSLVVRKRRVKGTEVLCLVDGREQPPSVASDVSGG